MKTRRSVSRLVLCLFVAALFNVALHSPQASATIVLTTAVSVPNVTRWKVSKLSDNRDEAEPYMMVAIEALGAGGVVYGPPQGSAWGIGPWHVFVTDSASTCQGLRAKASPVGYYDKFEIIYPGVTGALTALLTAVDGASTRANKWKAAEVSLLATGVLAANMAGTQN